MNIIFHIFPISLFAFFQTTFDVVLQDLVEILTCPDCGFTKVPTMSHSPYRLPVMFFCSKLFKAILALNSRQFDEFTERYWRGEPQTWRNLSY